MFLTVLFFIVYSYVYKFSNFYLVKFYYLDEQNIKIIFCYFGQRVQLCYKVYRNCKLLFYCIDEVDFYCDYFLLIIDILLFWLLLCDK